VREIWRVLKPGRLIALHPIWVRSDEEVRALGEDLVKLLPTFGFQQTRLEFKSISPRAYVCAFGVKA